MFQTVYRLISSRDSLLTILLPAFLYLLVYQWFDLVWAVATASLYGVVITFFRRDLGLISIAFALSGLIELGIIVFVPEKIFIEAVLFKVALGSLSSAAVFLVFSLIQKPIPMLVAEISTPALKNSRELNNVPSLITWQQVSGLWVISYVCKAGFLLGSDHLSENELAVYTLMFGWPLYVGLIFLSVWYVTNCFKKTQLHDLK